MKVCTILILILQSRRSPELYRQEAEIWSCRRAQKNNSDFFGKNLLCLALVDINSRIEDELFFVYHRRPADR
jgi:hypothetical protein